VILKRGVILKRVLQRRARLPIDKNLEQTKQ
jgi:hypothetical protein